MITSVLAVPRMRTVALDAPAGILWIVTLGVKRVSPSTSTMPSSLIISALKADTDTGARVIDLLFDLNREFKTTLVLVTHDVRLAERCDRLLHLAGGRIVEAAAGGDSVHGS